MCSICLLTIGAIIAAVSSGSAGAFNQLKINEFQTLIEAYLPPGQRGAVVRERLNERLTQLATAPRPAAPSGWKSCVPFFRPNEARLEDRAEAAASATFESLRNAILRSDDRSDLQRRETARAMDTMANFYVELGNYSGDRANQVTKRVLTLLGPAVVPLVLVGAGGYLAQFPELCGDALGPLGRHMHHILLGAGAAGGLGVMGLMVSKRGRDWYTENATLEHDRSSGAHRGEIHFWTKIAEAWAADPLMPALTGTDINAVATNVLRRLNWTGEGVLGACEDMLAEPVCIACAKDAG